MLVLRAGFSGSACAWARGSTNSPRIFLVRRQAFASGVVGSANSEDAFKSHAQDPRGAVVKIFNTRQRPGWSVPWQDQPVESSTGSGAVIETVVGAGSDRRRAVLTAAHVIADARYLQVQRSTDRFSGEKFRARVTAVCHEADLALLVVDDPRALKSIAPLDVASADELPRVFDKVRVVGYPVGGDACSVTEGVVSRVEVQEYSHSLRAGLALTVDAAINSGNSGGPLIDAETARIVGVAFQKLVARGVELQGHAVPAPLIQRFLQKVEDTSLPSSPLPTRSGAPSESGESGESTTSSALELRMPSLRCDYQSLEPPALRRYLQVENRVGILICRVHHSGGANEAPAIRRGDVLLKFNGYDLDEHGFTNFLGRRLHFAAARDFCSVGDRVPLTVWREGAEVQLEHILHPAQYFVPRGQFDVRARYFVCGGLCFQPLSHEYLQGWNSNDRPVHLQELFLSGHLTPDRQEAVMLSQVLADNANSGYDSGWVGAPIVQSVNGEAVRDLSHLVSIVRKARRKSLEFLVFDLALASGPFQIVLPVDELAEADERMCHVYGVPAAMCSDDYLEFPSEPEGAS